MGAMNSPQASKVDQRTSFLKDALSYGEKRISLVDNKAGILALIQSGLFALFTWAKDYDKIELLPNITFSGIPSSFVLDFFVISLTFCTLLLLIQIVRPTKRILFGLRADLGDYGTENYVMWPKNGFPESPKVYGETLKSFNKRTIENNYRQAHYVALQLIKRKYKYYRWAGLLFKWMILLGFIRLLMKSSEVSMSLIPIHKLLFVLSGASFIVGTTFLAYSVKWQADDIARLINNKNAKKRAGIADSPSRKSLTNLIVGMILNATGYALLVISILISP
jgi:hypothetical protein